MSTLAPFSRIARRAGSLGYRAASAVFPSTMQKLAPYLHLWMSSPHTLKAGNYGSCLDDAKISVLRKKLAQVLEIEGDIIECGVFHGGSLMMIAEVCRQKGVEKRIHALDSFSGFDPSEFKADLARGYAREGLGRFEDNSLLYVKAKAWRLGLHGNIRFSKGYFIETLIDQLHNIDKLCFAHIDCDLYEPVRFCTEHIYPKMSRGGVMLFDDLTTSYVGASKAFEEFTGSNKCRQFAVRAGMGVVVV